MYHVSQKSIETFFYRSFLLERSCVFDTLSHKQTWQWNITDFYSIHFPIETQLFSEDVQSPWWITIGYM